MMRLVIACSALMAGVPGSDRPADDRAAYREAAARAGRDADAQVRLALWCEAHGLKAERVKHLALAVLADPRHAAARGLMGQVDDGGRWRRPEAVAERVKADTELSAALAEYNARRAKAPATAEAQWRLALWCEAHGLKAEAMVHYAAVTRLPPPRPRGHRGIVGVVRPDLPQDHREAAWRRLGYKRHGGRWMSREQIDAAEAEAEAQRKADARWRPLLEKWKVQLSDRDNAGRAGSALAGVTDPRAVRSVWDVFGKGGAADQLRAAQLLGQIDAPGASRALAMLAVSGRSAGVRRAATETLARRDPREFAGLLIDLLHDPLKYQARPVGGPGQPGELIVEGEEAIVKRSYSTPKAQGGSKNRELKELEAEKAAVVAEEQLLEDVAAIEMYNASVRATNPEIALILEQATGESFGEDRGAWKAWFIDQLGYSESRPASKPTFDQRVPPAYQPVRYPSCFGAGTLVRALDGLWPIETLKVGDVVLAQDTATGALGYRPILSIHHNPPARTLKVALGGEAIVSSTYHRFWVAGRGWVMARELKVGDAVRTLGGVAAVTAIEEGAVQPVYNLDVASDRDFFAGNLGALVHDNSIPEPRRQPFDAPAWQEGTTEE